MHADNNAHPASKKAINLAPNFTEQNNPTNICEPHIEFLVFWQPF